MVYRRGDSTILLEANPEGNRIWSLAKHRVLSIGPIVNQSSPSFFANTWSGESFDSAYTHMRFPSVKPEGYAQFRLEAAPADRSPRPFDLA